MTARTPTYLKARYEQGDIPQGTDYEDVFDSYLNVAVSAEQTIDSNLKTTKELIASVVSAVTVNATTLNASTINGAIVSATSLLSPSANLASVSADNINVSGSVIFGTLDVSALATTQAGAVTLTGTRSFIIFGDGNNNAVKLPSSVRGREQQIINASTTTIKIYPAVSGRFLVTAVNAPLNLLADKTAIIFHKGDDRYGIVIGGF